MKNILLIKPFSGSRPKGGAINNGVVSLGGENINLNGELKFDNVRYVPREFYEKNINKKVLINDILICKDGAQTGKIAIVKNNYQYKDSMINEHLFILRTNNLLCSQKLLFYILFSKKGQELIKEKINKSAVSGLNLEIENIKLNIPSIKIQEKILKQIEEIEQQQEQLKKDLENYKQEKKNVVQNYLY